MNETRSIVLRGRGVSTSGLLDARSSAFSAPILMVLLISLATGNVILGQDNLYRSQKLVEQERFFVDRSSDFVVTPDGDRLWRVGAS